MAITCEDIEIDMDNFQGSALHQVDNVRRFLSTMKLDDDISTMVDQPMNISERNIERLRSHNINTMRQFINSDVDELPAFGRHASTIRALLETLQNNEDKFL